MKQPEMLIPLPDWPGYFAGSDGHIWSLWTRGLNARIDQSREPRKLRGGKRSGYFGVVLVREDGFRCSKNIHPLICAAFHGSRPGPEFEASHLNGVKTDNRPSNLLWETKSDNRNRRLEHDGGDHGWRNSRAALTEEQIAEIRAALASGEKHKDIARRYGVARSTISKINNGSRYPVKGEV